MNKKLKNKPEYKDRHFSVLPEMLEIDLPARIENILRELFPDLSRNKFKRICDEGSVHVNNKIAKAGMLISDISEIYFRITPEPVPSISRTGIKDKIQIPELEILFEDEFLLAINKPRGMHSVLQRESDPLTLADLLANYNPELLKSGKDIKEAGLVQRLDYWTSGCILACKSKKIWNLMHEEFGYQNVTKSYLALVEKNSRNQFDPFEEMENIKIEKVTDYSFGSLLRVISSEGSRHIVRKALSEIGLPLIGDKEYGSDLDSTFLVLENNKPSAPGFMLHAESINFTHPVTREKVIIET